MQGRFKAATLRRLSQDKVQDIGVVAFNHGLRFNLGYLIKKVFENPNFEV